MQGPIRLPSYRLHRQFSAGRRGGIIPTELMFYLLVVGEQGAAEALEEFLCILIKRVRGGCLSPQDRRD